MLNSRTGRLRYIGKQGPGIRRLRAGRGFQYLVAKGTRIKNPKTLSRIRSLAIPPAWKDVWICPDELGHLQATGRDAKGRKQYRYHPRFRSRRDETKFARLIDFARRLPLLRRRIPVSYTHLTLPTIYSV